MPGLHISYVGRTSHFWYDHPKGMPKAKFIAETLVAHHENWGREQVKVDGEDVTREVPAADVLAVYGTRLTADPEGNAVVENPEPVDVGAILSPA